MSMIRAGDEEALVVGSDAIEKLHVETLPPVEQVA